MRSKAEAIFASLVLALAAVPSFAQNSSRTAEDPGSFMACVNKATRDNPGPDLTKRNEAVKQCQNAAAFQIEENKELFYAKQKKIVEDQISTEREYIRKTRALIEISEAAIKEQLKDPDSALFEWSGGFAFVGYKPTLFSKVRTGFGACGFVNARNSFGGYVGKQRFLVVFASIDGVLVHSSIGTGQALDLTEVACSKGSFPPLPQAIDTVQAQLPKPLSVAAELETLVRLRDTGALSASEFELAKAKLLGTR